MTEMKKTQFAVAMKNFFGMLPGQTVADFSRELKALTTEDRAEFKTLLATVGYEVIN